MGEKLTVQLPKGAVRTNAHLCSYIFILQATSVRELKEQINCKDSSLPPYLQRISFQAAGTLYMQVLKVPEHVCNLAYVCKLAALMFCRW